MPEHPMEKDVKIAYVKEDILEQGNTVIELLEILFPSVWGTAKNMNDLVNPDFKKGVIGLLEENNHIHIFKQQEKWYCLINVTEFDEEDECYIDHYVMDKADGIIDSFVSCIDEVRKHVDFYTYYNQIYERLNHDYFKFC